MRIATYNLWNAPRGMPGRVETIKGELGSLEVDVLCLQEVRESLLPMVRSTLKDWHFFFHPQPYAEEEKAGLLLASRLPLLEQKGMPWAQMAILPWMGQRILVGNVHLPCTGVRENQRWLLEAVAELAKASADYAFLAGDFNSTGTSDAHRFLTGDCLLEGREAQPPWADLAEVEAQISGEPMALTLDVQKNPRWGQSRPATTGGRLDRIYLRDPFPKPYPPMEGLRIFGTRVDRTTGYAASDHYGVVATVRLPRKVQGETPWGHPMEGRV